ncbi:hypothetical protein GA0115239_108623 [Streptomyces sp. BpilaLS-43]|nr:hypothetical protein GA0115239_108623 [Streptomyces sp. BpilaLS-43]
MFCDPPMYGREDAGHSSTSATHQPPATTIARADTPSCPNRFRTDTGAHTAYSTASGGRIRNACRVLDRNASPTAIPAHTSHFVRPPSRARSTQ